jgi:hypothetical protein
LNRLIIFAAGVAATLGFGAVWHGPLGTGDKLAARGEKLARATLDHYERPMNSAHFERGPLSRTLVLSGPADEFQRGEMARILREIPGVAAVRWDPGSLPQEGGR